MLPETAFSRVSMSRAMYDYDYDYGYDYDYVRLYDYAHVHVNDYGESRSIAKTVPYAFPIPRSGIFLRHQRALELFPSEFQ